MIGLAKLLKLNCLLAALVLISIGCRNDVSGQYSYVVPDLIDDGLDAGSVREANIDTSLIFKALGKIKRGKYDEVHSLLIFKDDKLVVEEYFAGHDYNWDQPKFRGEIISWDKNRIHNIMSDTKSVTSALVGIAIEKGFIKSEQESIFKYLPDYQQFENGGREKIRIEHLLTMTSGLEGNEWVSSYRNLDNPIISLWLCDDPLHCILDRPMVAEPGTFFSYWGGNQILLGEIIKNASGMTFNEFAEKYLFEPLGITEYEWPLVNNGPPDAAGGLKISPRAMVKIGATFLNNGRWQGKQIISESWVRKSAVPYKNNVEIKVPGEKSWRHGYTYGWWTRSFEDYDLDIYFAGGWGGQNIMIAPDENMVVVFTGGNFTSIPPPKKLMDKYIIPAVR